MYKYLILGALLWATPVMAATSPEKPPADPSCGKTVQECQKVIDSLQTAVTQLNAAYNGLIQQREQAERSYLDLQLQVFIKETTSKKTP